MKSVCKKKTEAIVLKHQRKKILIVSKVSNKALQSQQHGRKLFWQSKNEIVETGVS